MSLFRTSVPFRFTKWRPFRHTSAEASPLFSGPMRSPNESSLCECRRWWVGECAACWPKFTRRVVWNGGNRRAELGGFLRYWLDCHTKPCACCRAGYWTPQYGQPSMTSPPYIRQRGCVVDYGKTSLHGMPGQPIRLHARGPVAIRKAHLNLTTLVCHSLKRTQANILRPPRKSIYYR